jgi:hypothetical protein
MLTLTEVKNWLKVQHNEEDDLIESLVVSALQAIETHTNRTVVRTTKVVDYVPSQSRDWDFRNVGPPSLNLSGHNVAVNEVKRWLGDQEEVLQPQHYVVSGNTVTFGRVFTTREGGVRYRVTYQSGWLPADSAEIENVRQAAKMIIASWYANREAFLTGSIVSNFPLSATMILNNFVSYE